MDFLHFTSEDFLFIGGLIGGIVGVLAIVITYSEKGWEYASIPTAATVVILSLCFFGNLNGQRQWRDKTIEYYPSNTIETIKYKDGSMVQYVYSHDGERVNITELYGQFFEEGSTYMEINRNVYSWFLFNYDRYIENKLEQKVYRFSPPLTSDK